MCASPFVHQKPFLGIKNELYESTMKHFYLAAIASCAILSACSSSNSSDVAATEERDVAIAFAAEANGNPISCDNLLTGLGTQNTNAILMDFRFYVHDASLLDENGKAYPITLNESPNTYKNLELLDFTNRASCDSQNPIKEQNTELTGSVTIPSNTALIGVTFTLGVPPSLNHLDAAPANNPNILRDTIGMHWSWTTGYKFARFDIAPDGGMTRPSDPNYSASKWNFHLGSTKCGGTPQTDGTVTCARPNRPTIRLNNFDHKSDTITLDFEALLQKVNLSQDEGGKAGCMTMPTPSGSEDPECIEPFKALGMDVSTGKADSTVAQTMFRVN